MYSNPIEEKEFRFYLNFKNDNTGLLEITEPVGFDASVFVIEQDSKRYGRDVFYMNEEVSLTFYNDICEVTNTPQILPNGEQLNHLSFAFDYLNIYYREFGFESEVEFILERNDIQFITGVLDFATADTDELTFLKCKVIQNTKQAQIKRREDVEIDLFSDKDLDNNTIVPLSTKNILLKAKPVIQLSKWKSNDDDALGFSSTVNTNDLLNIPTTFTTGSNNSNIVEKYGIDNTLSFMSNRYALNSFGFPNDGLNFTYLEAQEELTNVTIDITDLNAFTRQSKNDFFSNIVLSGSGYVKFVVKYGFDNGIGNDLETIVLYEKNFGFVNNTPIEYLPTSFSVTIPLIQRGMRLWIYLEPFSEATFNQYQSSSLASYNIYATMNSMNVEIKGTSTSIDSVIKGVRHIDLIKQTVKSINGMGVVAPKYDVGGNFYNNFVFNGKLIRQFDNEPFYSKFKDAVSQLQELNADYQINNNNVYIGQYNDYYNNNELNAFLQAPDNDYKSTYNDRYTINTMEYKYKSFEQDRDESNTIDAVHTETQWLLPNKQVENSLKINVDYVRDPFEIESSRKQGIYTKDTTSLSNDDKIYIIDVVGLAPNSRNNFTAFLSYQYSQDDNNLKLLSNGNFNWTLLGFNIGNIVSVKIGDATIRDFQVFAYEGSVITLTPITGTITTDTTSSNVIYFDYPLTNVEFVNRTNQEFQLIENVESPENYSNLQYTIKRNLKYFESYLACASKYKANGIIKNTYFKSNGNLVTEFRNGGEITENADYNVDELEQRLIEPIIIETTVIAEYDDILDLLNSMQTINADNSIGGFIRVMDSNNKVINLYPKKISYNWGTKQLDITGEQRFEADTIEITKENNLIFINKVGYDEVILKPLEVKTNGDYVQLLDFRGIALFNEIKFEKVFVNSNNFSNIVELTDALINL